MKALFTIIAICAVCFFAGSAQAVTLFSDDFTGTTIDSSKWSVENGYGSVNQNNEAIFTMLGNNAPNSGVHLRSVSFAVSHDTTEVVFSGTWRVAQSTYTAEPDIYVFNADDPTKYIRVGYSTWGDALDFTDTTLGSPIANYSRGHNLTSVPFEFHFTDSGWTYEENGVVLRDVTSDFTHGIENTFIKIGGWDYSQISDQIGYFDDINVDARVVPEPASLSFLSLGLFGFLKFRKRKEVNK